MQATRHKEKHEVMRQCALTREALPVDDLLRFAVSPDGVVVPDTDAKAEGRGVWITLSYDCVGEAVKRKAFAKSLKEAVTVAPDLADLSRLRLEQRLLSALSMARKAGQIVVGAGKVKTAIEAGEVIALLTAKDAAPDGRNKMHNALKALNFARAEAGARELSAPHFELLDSRQLDLALGLENVIHAALTKGAAAQSAMGRAERLARFIAPLTKDETAIHG